MDARQCLRVQAMGTLMSLLRSPDVRLSMRHPDDQSGHEVIVALPDDTLRYICERVHAAGGAATVAVCMSLDESEFRLVTMDVSDRSAASLGPVDDDLGTVDGGSSVSFALEYMDNARLKTMSWRLESPDCTLEVVDSGGVAPVCPC